MSAQQFYLLPTRLAGARRRRGMPQKVAAATIGVAQSVLCALEKGRRRPLDAAVLHRLGDAYGLNDDERDELTFAAAHDQLLLSVRGLNLDRYAELISAVLQAGHPLSGRGQGHVCAEHAGGSLPMRYELRPPVGIFENALAGNVCFVAMRRAESMLTTTDHVC